MSNFKDLFSVQANDYAKFRPSYSAELFSYLAGLTECHDLAWDVGTGNGQAAIELAKYYDKVVATDPSEKQLEKAILHAKISYLAGRTEKSPLSDGEADLVTVAQAFHWFQQKEFFAEVKRVVKPAGILAIWCYGMAQINPEIDNKVFELYEGILKDYWEPERKLVEEGYRNVQVPFKEIQTPKLQLKAAWTLEHLVGYLSTWSALQSYIRKNSINPLEKFYPELKAAWGAEHTRPVTWDLGLRVFQV